MNHKSVNHVAAHTIQFSQYVQSLYSTVSKYAHVQLYVFWNGHASIKHGSTVIASLMWHYITVDIKNCVFTYKITEHCTEN